MNIPETNIVVGQVMRFIENKHGGFWLVWSEHGRFRIYPSQFSTPPASGEIVSFLPDPQSSGNVRRVTTVLFQEPDASQSSIEGNSK